MRLSLATRQQDNQRANRAGKSRVGDEQKGRRDQVAATAETVALVLDEDSPLPETAADVDDLVRRLRGHIQQLGVMLPTEEPALGRAQQLGSAPVPDDYVPSRVYLVRLAEATQNLATAVETRESGSARERPRRHRPTVPLNMVRGAVFFLALVCLILAASVSRT